MRLAEGHRGRLCVTEVADIDAWVDYSEYFKNNKSTVASNIAGNLRHGQLVKCRILSDPSDTNGVVEVSIRPSRVVYEIVL